MNNSNCGALNTHWPRNALYTTHWSYTREVVNGSQEVLPFYKHHLNITGTNFRGAKRSQTLDNSFKFVQILNKFLLSPHPHPSEPLRWTFSFVTDIISISSVKFGQKSSAISTWNWCSFLMWFFYTIIEILDISIHFNFVKFFNVAIIFIQVWYTGIVWYRQLGCLAFSLRFRPKIKQLLSNCPTSGWTFF